MLIGSIICTVETESDGVKRHVDKRYRGKGIVSKLVTCGIHRMVEGGSKEVYLETEVRSLH